MQPDDVIEVCQSKRSEENCMERWNELVAGFVLGNLTPEEAESIAEILAENPQLASDIARLRNTATVRSLRTTEWSTARSQDGSEGWVDTTLDLPMASVVLEEISTRAAVAGTIRLGANRVEAGRSKKGMSEADRAIEVLPTLRFEPFSMIEAVLVPLFNPLWWTVFVAVVALGIDDFRVRRSLSEALKEMSQIEAAPQLPVLEQPSPLNNTDGRLLDAR
ncbi:MAG: hypothetical protein DCF25_17505 [Leptolyngbya foveolarum]|uniref:Zinc-finger domain-containing protein n=1 Tax=Leptolyngbya foveolarum TaxID=47253 RepID=A0A2W4W0A1_9CYAN|nr:MAG: hypothetical protein DCF25_17505 [Leptolyngbya foveolarum]